MPAQTFSVLASSFSNGNWRRPLRENPLDTIDHIAHAEPEPVSRLNKAVSSELQAIISKCLEKDPQRRYQSAGVLMQELVALKQDVRPRLYRKARLALALLSTLLVLPLIPTAQQVMSGWFGLIELPSEKYVAVLPFHL
jgi:serine/threonine protein kinase